MSASLCVSPVLVQEAMHRGVITCRADTSAFAVVRRMAAHRIHSVLVVDDDGVCGGIVCDTELECALATGNLATLVASEIAVDPVAVDPSQSLERAIELMHERATTHLVVADAGTQRAIGVLSMLDVAEVLSEGGAR